MDNITFSGRGAFSYVWAKNVDNRRLTRLFTALGAAIVGFICGYKVKHEDVLPYTLGSTKDYFIREFHRKTLGHREISVAGTENDKNHKTKPHSGQFYGNWPNTSAGDSYITENVKSNTKGEKSVKITVGKNANNSSTLNYAFIKTETNKNAYTALSETLDLASSNGTPPPSSDLYQKISTKVSEKKSQLPTFEFLQGDCAKQNKYVENHSGGNKVVVLNASQINYQEQIDNSHDILKDISSVYQDKTFGPAMVKTEKGGVELLAHTLIESNDVTFSGAFFDFFTEQTLQYKHKLQANGGYYSSDLKKEEWDKLAEELIHSNTKTEGFRWGSDNGKSIYQTGAINASEGRALYSKLHKNAPPPPVFQFLILFFQMRNALLQEVNNNESVVLHTTSIGEGVFGNRQNLSFTALQAAIHSLPDEKRSRIKKVFFGSYLDTNACDILGGKIIPVGQ